jgi:spermidine/putrescine transport system permease protein
MKLASTIWVFVLAMVLCFLVLPLLLVMIFSLATNPVSRFPIEGFTLDWYADLFSDREFLVAFQNSMIIGVPASALTTITGTMAALAFTRSDRSTVLLSVLSTPIMLPPLVIAIGLVVLFVRWLAFPLGIPAVVAGHVLLTQPLVAFVIAARLQTFDETSMEAARDLGATALQAFWRVKFPQIRTAMIGAALMAFAISLDEFIITVFTIGSGNTLSTFMWGKMRTSLDPSINAIATLTLLMTIFFVAASLYLSRKRTIRPAPFAGVAGPASIDMGSRSTG